MHLCLLLITFKVLNFQNMESFKIKDFNIAFKMGIENLVSEAIINNSKKKKLKKKLKISEALSIIKNDIFVRFFIIIHGISRKS